MIYLSFNKHFFFKENDITKKIQRQGQKMKNNWLVLQ